MTLPLDARLLSSFAGVGDTFAEKLRVTLQDPEPKIRIATAGVFVEELKNALTEEADRHCFDHMMLYKMCIGKNLN
jgi:hypothetical protein